MTTTQPRKLVRLRTAPMPDPGEWCNVCALLCDAPMIPPDCECSERPSDEDCQLWDPDECGCSAGFAPERLIEPFVAGYRRPQSCIDAAEVET